MNRNKIFLYVFIVLVIIKVGLLFPTRQSARDVIEIADKFENLRKELEGISHFDDSLAGNENFRRRLLDTVKTVAELRQARKNQREELEKGIQCCPAKLNMKKRKGRRLPP